MSITYNVGVLLGRSPLPASDQEQADLLAAWTAARITAAALAALVTLDPIVRDRVVAKAVARYMGTPRDGMTQQTVQVDDAQITRAFGGSSSTPHGEVEILPEWWTELGLGGSDSGTFSVRPTFQP